MKKSDEPIDKKIIDWEIIDITPDDINTQSVKTGNSYLHEAAKKGDLDLVKYLVVHGADITLTNREGKTAKQLAIDNKITPLGSLYNKAASALLGKSKYQDTEEVYNYLDQAEKNLAVAETQRKADFKILKLQTELDMVPLIAIGDKLRQADEELDKEEDIDDLKRIEENIKARTPGSGGLTDAEFDEDLRKVTAELDEILASEAPRDPNLPIENFSDKELDNLGIKLELEVMQELQKAKRDLTTTSESKDINNTSSEHRRINTSQRPGGRY